MKGLKFILFFALTLLMVDSTSAIEKMGEEVSEKKIGFFTELGKQVDLSLSFTDTEGKVVKLQELFSSEVPMILVPVYYGCPRLCGLLLNGFISMVKELDLKMGTQYRVVTVSFNPDEKPPLAQSKSNAVYQQIGREDVNSSTWRFLVGDESNVKALMDQVGFRYEKDQGEYAHSSGFIILTPKGEISQYFTGIEFSPWDVRLSLIEASRGSIGTAVDHILLFCYRFDPTKGKYTLVAFNVLRGGVLASVLLCALFIYLYSRKAKRA